MSFEMKHRDTFCAVLNNFDDQVIVRDLLIELVPSKIQAEIVRRFNEHVDGRNWQRAAREDGA